MSTALTDEALVTDTVSRAPEHDSGAGGNAPDSRARGGGRGERVTVNLSPATSGALEHAVQITGDSKTDTINRALQIYAMLADAVNDGSHVLIRDPAGEVERQRIFPERYDRAPGKGEKAS